MGDAYLSWRESRIDRTEYLDILYALKSLGAEKDDPVFELCAGGGGLIRYLRGKGYRHVSGCDIRGDGKTVLTCDLNKGLPGYAAAKYYVFQHCLEHLEQVAAKNILRECMRRGEGVVGILPGHMVGDPTHVVNHYHLEDVVDLALSSGAEYVLVTLDMASYVHPESRDWLIVLSHRPFRLRRPWWFALMLRFARHMLGRCVGCR